jgi:acyl-CoA oxidase
VKNFLDNPRAIFAIHDFAVESGTATKMTVQFNLFGGSVLKLGTKLHHDLIDGIDQVDEIGCFALTELGYGNNAAKMETIAVLDMTHDEWIINTPTILSQKYWITNGAVHAHWSVVFAQMLIKNKNYGVHAFLVPIRNQDLTVCTGVKIEDMGVKFGCNGVDNAKLQFKNVRIPRTALLNRYSNVERDGTFTSIIKKKRDRFLKVADQLLSGRICICCMTMCSDRIVLATTLLYSASRLTIGDNGQSNYPILGYQLQQNAIMPLIASQVSLNVALNHVKDRYSGIHPNLDHQELVIFCCIIKPLVTWHCNESANICRERCGGQGYLSVNRVAEGIPGAHAGMTAEGDNRVLVQKACKELLEKLKKREYKFPGNIKSNKSNDILSLYQAFVQREALLFTKLSNVLKNELIRGKSLFDIWSLKYQDLVQESAEAFGERIIL